MADREVLLYFSSQISVVKKLYEDDEKIVIYYILFVNIFITLKNNLLVILCEKSKKGLIKLCTIKMVPHRE